MALLNTIPARHRVIVLGPAPEFPFSVPDEMIKNLRFGRDEEPFPRARFDARAERTIEILAAATTATGTEFLQLSDRFCDDTQCRFERNGIPLFADSVHFSKEGNAFLFEILSEHLARTD